MCTLLDLACTDCAMKLCKIQKNEMISQLLRKCLDKHNIAKCAHNKIQGAQTLAMEPYKIKEKERQFQNPQLISQILRIICVPLEMGT